MLVGSAPDRGAAVLVFRCHVLRHEVRNVKAKGCCGFIRHLYQVAPSVL